MKNYMNINATLIRFHIYNKLHIVNRIILEKSWTLVQNEKRKLRVDMERKDYVKLLEKYKINNFS
jgi:hypothetical protein